MLLKESFVVGLQSAVRNGLVIWRISAIELEVVADNGVIGVILHRVVILSRLAVLLTMGLVHLLIEALGTVVSGIIQTRMPDITQHVVEGPVLEQNPNDALDFGLEVGNRGLGAGLVAERGRDLRLLLQFRLHLTRPQVMGDLRDLLRLGGVGVGDRLSERIQRRKGSTGRHPVERVVVLDGSRADWILEGRCVIPLRERMPAFIQLGARREDTIVNVELWSCCSPVQPLLSYNWMGELPSYPWKVVRDEM